MALRIREALCFDDVQLVDGINPVTSRSEVVLTNEAGYIPIFISPMMAVNSVEMQDAAIENNIVHVFHRYNTFQERMTFLDEGGWGDDARNNIGLSIGMNDTDEDILELAKYAGHLNFDVAACYSKAVIERATEILTLLEHVDVHLILGNYSNPEFAAHISSLVDRRFGGSYNLTLKVSQGGSGVCSTRLMTGVGVPTFQAVLDSVEYTERASLGLIADGGVKTPGDMMKAFGAGATGIMAGGIFAAHTECSEEYRIVTDQGVFYEYFGMASERAKKGHFTEVKNIEGVSSLKRHKGSVHRTIAMILDGLRSGISMTGHSSLTSLIENKASFVRVSGAGVMEASTYAKLGPNFG